MWLQMKIPVQSTGIILAVFLLSLFIKYTSLFMQSGKVLKLHRITKLLDPRQIEQPHNSTFWLFLISLAHKRNGFDQTWKGFTIATNCAMDYYLFTGFNSFQLYRINKRFIHLALNFNIIPLYFPSYSGQQNVFYNIFGWEICYYRQVWVTSNNFNVHSYS